MEEREVFSQTDVRLKRKIITKTMEQPVLVVTVLLLLWGVKIMESWKGKFERSAAGHLLPCTLEAS